MISRLQYISQQTASLSHTDAIRRALDAGCTWIQLRIKEQPEAAVLQAAVVAKRLCEAAGATLIINDYPAVAKAVSADGLHLGLQDMPIAAARKLVGNSMLIGGTANTLEDVLQRVQEGADYVGLGPYRFTTTKQKLSPVLGIEGYARMLTQLQQRKLSIPIIAIGGILPEDVAALRNAGVHGVAVSGAITHAADAAATVKALHAMLEPTTVAEANVYSHHFSQTANDVTDCR